MTKFKELLEQNTYVGKMDFPSVSLTYGPHELALRFDSKDQIISSLYLGPSDPWLSSLCYLIEGKHLHSLLQLSWKEWDEAFKEDTFYWELRQEESEKFFSKHFEMLRGALELYRGRDYLYQESSPLICRCFGVRESDVVAHLKAEANPTLDTLATATKASMGCRSCVPQLKRWLLLSDSKKENRFYKNKSHADWLVEIDYMLSCFPKAEDWKMEVRQFKDNQVIISFDKSVTQLDEEKTAKELQDFLRASLDLELSFFLRAARHFS